MGVVQAEQESSPWSTAKGFLEYQRNRCSVNFRKIDAPKVCAYQLL